MANARIEREAVIRPSISVLVVPTLYRRCGFSLSANPSNKRDRGTKKGRKRGTTGRMDGWKREIESWSTKRSTGELAIILFLSRASRVLWRKPDRTVGARSTICRRFAAILMGWCAIERRLSPAEQSSSFLLDAQDNQDSAEFPLCRSIRIASWIMITEI